MRDGGVHDGLAVGIVENGQGHAPGALAADAPVRATLDGAVDAIAAPGGQPVHGVDGLQGIGAEVADADEELLHGAEDDGRLRAPAVRILVNVGRVAQQRAFALQELDDAFVALEDVFANEIGQSALGGVAARVIDGREDFQTVLASGDVVVRAVAGRHVDGAGAGVVGDEEGVDDLRTTREEGMLRLAAIEQAAFELLRRMRGIEHVTGFLLEGLESRGGDDELQGVRLLGVRETAADVVEVRVQGDAEVRGQRPGRGGPDDEVGAFEARRRVVDGKRHVDGRRGLLLILDLRLGESGLRPEAPEHGPLGTIDKALLHKLGEGAHDVGLVGGREGQVGVVPVTEDAEALEGFFLHLHKAAGKRLGACADFGGAEILGFLHHLELDGQTVAVPAGDVGRVKAGHRLRFDDEVLQHLVQRGAHVHVAIRERRAVMQDELRLAGHLLHDALVKPGLLPLRQPLRFTRDEIGFHRKVGLRRADGVLVVLLVCVRGAHGVGKRRARVARCCGGSRCGDPVRH